MAAVPFVPVFSKVEQHIAQLKEQGIRHIHAGWTLGGSPSPNLRLAAWLMEDKGDLRAFLQNWLGEALADGVYRAQSKICDAFSHYPFHLDTLYFGPQNYGPMAPFFLEKTGYEATMIGYPYDDVEKWSGIYPVDVYENAYRQLVEGWQEGVADLLTYQGRNTELDKVILMARAALCHYESAYHHIQFAICRNKALAQRTELPKQGLLPVIREEMQTVRTLIELRLQDSCIGYESSNHYFYTLQDLKEKLINLSYCEEMLASAEKSWGLFDH